MKILVTGGLGFIGGHLVKELKKQNHQVVIIDKKQVRKNNYYQQDLTNYHRVYDILNYERPELVLHLAGLAGVQPSIIRPYEYYYNNVVSTLNLLEACRQLNIKKFVFASSSSVYGNNKNVPFKENDPINNIQSPYASSKKIMEELVSQYSKQYGIKCVGLRYFTVFGENNRRDMAIYQFAIKVMNDELINLYKANMVVKRDWTYVGDIVDGTIKAINKIDKYEFKIFNLGNNNPITPRYLLSLLEKDFGKKAKIKYTSLPKGDVPITYAGIEEARIGLGWKPKTKIEDGIKKFCAWFKGESL